MLKCRLTLWIASGVWVLAAFLPASADEGGVPFWFSGQEASFAAVAPDPGFYFPVMGYYYDGSASGSRTFEHGNLISAGLESRVPLILAYPTLAPDFKLLGGQPAFTLGFGGGYQRTTVKISTSRLGTIVDHSDSVVGVTDLYPMMSLFWNVGSVSHVMTYLTGDAPVGDYDPNRLANISLGHGAVDAGGDTPISTKRADWRPPPWSGSPTTSRIPRSTTRVAWMPIWTTRFPSS